MYVLQLETKRSDDMLYAYLAQLCLVLNSTSEPAVERLFC